MPSNEVSSHPLSARRIITAVADAAQRWCNADYPPRVRATRRLRERTGYSEPVIDYALDRLFGGCTAAGLQATITAELGSVDALDGFVERPNGTAVHARGLNNVKILSSRTTIGVALPAAVYALCAKARVTVKDREDGFIQAFFATLHEEEPALREYARAQAWDGPDDPDPSHADAVVVFGTDATLREVHRSLNPPARFIGYGPATGCVFVRRAESTGAAAAAMLAQIARDAVLYDGEGCMSPHLVFLIDEQHTSGAIAPDFPAFAKALAAALHAASIEFPAAERSPEEQLQRAGQIRSIRFRAIAQGRIFAEEGDHLAVIDETSPPLFCARTLLVVPVATPAAVRAYLAEHGVCIEAAGLPPNANIRDMRAWLEAAGAARYAPLGELQNPRFDAPHGGRPRIAEFVRLISAEALR